MSIKADWYYHRKGCATCLKSQGFLAKSKIEVTEQGDAKKLRLGPSDAMKMAREADKIVVARGKKVITFDMKSDPPNRTVLLECILGPTGNLRAPVIRRGSTLLIGFNEDAYAEAFGLRK